jgi:hypothetical protein
MTDYINLMLDTKNLFDGRELKFYYRISNSTTISVHVILFFVKKLLIAKSV